MSNIVAIVGRPNVGKSTLFNRLIEQRKSIMDNQSGVTRDRLYGQVEWTGKSFTVIDTGGYVVGSEDTFEQAIREQVKIAIEEADVVLFMVDCMTGLTELDKDFANVVRQFDKPVFLVANKADDYEKSLNAVEFYELALGDIHNISSQTGSGTGDLLDKIIEALPNQVVEDNTENIPKIAVLGRPNVGKSSFVNALVGEERNIVTDIAGTTRDALNTHYKYFGKNFILTDTAGIRKKSKVKENIEFYSVMRSLRALESSDVCVVILDAERGIEAQDVNIISLAVRNGKGVVVMVNKWDLIEKVTDTAKKYTEKIHERLAPMTYIPIVYCSVLNKQRIFKAISMAIEVFENKQNKIPTSQLNTLILPEIERYPPPAIRGKYINIKYITQLKTHKPSFAFFCNYPQLVKEPYKRFLENQLRKHFGFEGVPINVFLRKK